MTATVNLINLPPPSMPLVTKDQKIERSWYMCIRQIIEQLGGFTSPMLSPDDLAQLADNEVDLATADIPVLSSRISDLDRRLVDQDLQEYPAIQDVSDALLLAYTALDQLADAFSNFALPTAKVGLSAIVGVATTAMRSDAAPALNQAITPTWTGLHNFTGGIDINGVPIFAGFPNSPGTTVLQTGNYTLVITDAQTSLSNFSGVNRTATIPANSAVPFPVGTLLILTNGGAGVFSVAITSDTLILAGTSTTGTRSLAANGFMFLFKQFPTQWISWGAGLT